MKPAKTFTVYDEVMRLPISRVTCAEDQIQDYLKPGQRAVPGRQDWATRLDDNNTVVVDQQRERALSRERRRQAAMVRIEELERKMLRRVREILAANDPALKVIDDEVTVLRASLVDE